MDVIAELERWRSRLGLQWMVPTPRTVIRPRKEITEALIRCQRSMSYYAHDIQDLKITTLYEYAAQRLLRDCVCHLPETIADLREYEQHYQSWWNRWQDQ